MNFVENQKTILDIELLIKRLTGRCLEILRKHKFVSFVSLNLTKILAISFKRVQYAKTFELK